LTDSLGTKVIVTAVSPPLPLLREGVAMRRARLTRSRVAKRLRRGILGCALAAILGLLVIASGAAAATGVDITTVEGQSFTGNVVNGLTCPLLSATIAWGDGTTSAGTSDGSTGIQGTHTYAEEGTYSGSVSYTYTSGGVFSCPTGVQTATFQATVQDAALTWLGRNLTGTAGQPVGGVLAHFSDANPAAGAGDFSAQITWGDGATSSGSVSTPAGGGFDVSGSHAYASAGSYTVSVTIADAGGSTATTSSTAQITPAPPPPPPPPQTSLTASFRVIPPSPCPETDTLLDASASTPTTGDGPITYYWLITYSVPDSGDHFGPEEPPKQVFDRIVTSDPRLHYSFPYSKQYGGVDLGHHAFNTAYGVLDFWANYIRLLRSPVQVLLRVQQNHADLARRQVKTITFTNPELTAEEGTLAYNTQNMNFFGLVGPIIFNVSGGHGCPSLTDRAFFGTKALPRSVALAKLVHLTLSLDNRGTLITVPVRCQNRVKDCLASLVVLPRSPRLRRARIQSARARRSPPSLGTRTFVAPAGRTISVPVRLNARGRALVRAHHLHQVTLLLESAGAEGRIVLTTRTVRLRAGR
jgi:hypothetical protein